MEIKIAKEISLPTEAITQTFAQIGKRGAGKTYLASMIAEQMLDAGGQVIVLDPIGNWWGLRVNSDGKSKGKDIFVMGGQHGDVPLSPEAGREVAKILAEKNISVVLDISEFRKNDRKRFVTDFAEEFYHLKKRNPTPVHIFLEESQKFVPQKVFKGDEKMLGAFEDIVRLGRNHGIGCSLISQRPQSVNKEVLSQVECLCVLQVVGKHERKALEEWVKEAGEDRDIVDQLPGLKIGEGYVWSPGWLRIFKRVNFNKKTTFDTSKTPELGKATIVAKLSKVDIKKLQVYMTEVIEKAQKDLKEAKDFKAEIVRLKAELKKRPVETKVKEIFRVDEKALERARIQGFNECKTKMTEELNFLRKENTLLIKRDEKIADILKVPMPPRPEYKPVEIDKVVKVDKVVNHNPLPKLDVISSSVEVSNSGNGALPSADNNNGLNLCARKIYSFLFNNSDREFSRVQLATITGYSHRSGGFKDAISKLNVLNLIKKNGMLVSVNELNSELATEDMSELSIASWMNRLNKCARTMLQLLLDNPGTTFTRDDLAEQTGYSVTSGGFKDAISKLNVLGLIEKDGSDVKLNPEVLEL